MIDIRKLKELVRLMVTNELTEIDLRDSEEQVTLRRGGDTNSPPVVTTYPAAVSDAVPASTAAPAAQADAEPDGLVSIESPMVGTFYATPDPDSAPFVSVGDHVGPESVICLVEAMKIFNEIKAETSGRIEKVLVKSGEAVEFGQSLFMIKPD